MVWHNSNMQPWASRAGLWGAAGDGPTLVAAVRKALSSAGHFWRCAYFRVRVRKSSFLPFAHVFLTRPCTIRPSQSRSGRIVCLGLMAPRQDPCTAVPHQRVSYMTLII